MAFFLRTTTIPPLSQITAVPQIVVVDLTGPAVILGTQAGAACLVGEFVAGPFTPTEITSDQVYKSLYTANGTIYPYLSQDGSSPAIQNGKQVSYEGNGSLQLLSKTFQRLILTRVNHEAVTTDGGTTTSQLTLTITVDPADQTGGVTNKDIVIPSGARMGSANTFAGSTRVFGVSGTLAGNYVVPKGTTVTSNQVTQLVDCFPIVVIEPVVATAIAAITFVLDPVLPNVAPGTTITAVNNAAALWPAGTGTTLATRIASQYPAAISSTMPNFSPMSAITIIWAARRTQAIRQALAANANAASSVGRGRVACVSADPANGTNAAAAIAATTAAIGLAAADAYPQPADRVIITFPQHQIVVPDFANIAVTINADGMMATTLSNFANEVNPGAANDYVQAITAPEQAFVNTPLAYQDYANLIAAGVCALYFDRQAGWQWIQGVTAANSVSYPTRVPIKRRRMADEIEDTLGDIASPFLKQPSTIDRQQAFVLEIETYLEELKSTNTPAAQRIVNYSVDDVSGNTAAQLALGIFVVKVFVQLLASMDYIEYLATIGETVTIPVSVAAAA